MASGQRYRATQGVNKAEVEAFQCPRAYHDAAQTAVERAFDKATLNAAFRNGITSHETTVTDIVRPSYQIAMNQGQLILSLANASVSVRHQRRRQDHFEEDFEKRVSGSFELSIEVIQPDPRYDPFCSVEVDQVNLLFTVIPRTYFQSGNGIHIPNGAVIINDGTGQGNRIFGQGNNFSFSPGNNFTSGLRNNFSYSPGNNFSYCPGINFSFGPGINFSFGPVSHQSTWQSEDDSRPASPQNASEESRSRPNVAPTVCNGINQSVRSVDDYATIICSGISSHIVSSGQDAVIKCSGLSSDIISNGQNATINSSGASGSIASSGSNARIRDNGASVRVDSTGPNASIRCSGMSSTVNSSGSNALIESSGASNVIRSTGSNASISFSGTDTRIRSSGAAIKDDFGQTLIRALIDAVAESLKWSLRDNSLSRDWMQRSL